MINQAGRKVTLLPDSDGDGQTMAALLELLSGLQMANSPKEARG